MKIDKRIKNLEALISVLKRDGFPQGFNDDCGKIEFNSTSDFCGLIDEFENGYIDGVFVLEKDKIERFVNCLDCGKEGLEKDFEGFNFEGSLCKECSKWVKM